MDGELWRIWQVLFVLSVLNGTFMSPATCVAADSDPHEHLNPSSSFDDSQDVPGEPMTPIDYQNAQGIVADSPPKHDENGNHADPIEFAGLFEGDIILRDGQAQQFNENENQTRNGIIDERQKWRNGQIPYVISSDFSSQQRGVIAKAMIEYREKTCIQFIPRSTENDYIHIHRGGGCSSYVGRSGGAQPVSLGEGCVYTGIVIHELLHSVGFWHEQSRYDRDDFVTVYYNNIQSGMEFNFRKYSWKETQNLSVPYDLNSVMHYGAYAFTRYQGRPTILPKDPNKNIGQRGGFSSNDVEKINRLYNCKGEGSRPTTTTPSPATQAPSSCKDNHRHCRYWSERGECNKNPAWMKANCKSSCGQCHKPCEDLNKYCSSWSRRGECGRNPDYMLTYCQKSCNACPPASATEGTTKATTQAPSSCQDTEKHCKYWASNGECEKNPRYMSRNCPKSCNLC